MKFFTIVLIELFVVFVDCIDLENLNTTTAKVTVTYSPTTSTTTTTSSSRSIPAFTTTASPPTINFSTTTSTTPSPTPTPKPPAPEKGIWMVIAPDNSTCIYLEMATSIEFYYINIRNEIDKGHINIPAQAEVVGSCEEGDRHRQTIKLFWYFNSLFANTLEFVFRRNSHMYELDKVILNVTLNSEDFPTAKDTNKPLILINKNMHFLTPENRSYRCTRAHSLLLHQQRSNVDIAKMKIMHLRFQAFGNITDGYLARAMDCKPNPTTQSLFILLGSISMLCLVITITYLITKANHPFRGYLNVEKDGNRSKSERTKLCLQSGGIPRVLTNVEIITEREITVKPPYNSVKLLMKKFRRN